MCGLIIGACVQVLAGILEDELGEPPFETIPLLRGRHLTTPRVKGVNHGRKSQSQAVAAGFVKVL